MRLQELVECSGYIPQTEAEARDPRWTTALTQDIGINTMQEQLDRLFPQELDESGCKYGRYWCSTDKKYKCRQGPKQTRQS